MSGLPAIIFNQASVKAFVADGRATVYRLYADHECAELLYVGGDVADALLFAEAISTAISGEVEVKLEGGLVDPLTPVPSELPRTGAGRYLDRRLEDPEYRQAYDEASELVEYEVSVSNLFTASSPADAVGQMVAWLYEAAGRAGYRVTPVTGPSALPDGSVFIDAEHLELH
jgi:hypothetical protein